MRSTRPRSFAVGAWYLKRARYETGPGGSPLAYRSAFDLKNGRHCEGYVLEVNDDHLLFGHGGPLAPDEPERILLEDVDLGTLSYRDEEQRCWMDTRWDEAHGRWVTTVATPPPALGPVPKRRPWWKFW